MKKGKKRRVAEQQKGRRGEEREMATKLDHHVPAADKNRRKMRNNKQIKDKGVVVVATWTEWIVIRGKNIFWHHCIASSQVPYQVLKAFITKTYLL